MNVPYRCSKVHTEIQTYPPGTPEDRRSPQLPLALPCQCFTVIAFFHAFPPPVSTAGFLMSLLEKLTGEHGLSCHLYSIGATHVLLRYVAGVAAGCSELVSTHTCLRESCPMVPDQGRSLLEMVSPLHCIANLHCAPQPQHAPAAALHLGPLVPDASAEARPCSELSSTGSIVLLSLRGLSVC